MAYEASDSLGTLHVAHWVPFEHNHLGFFTIFDGDFEKYIQDFAEKTAFVFDAVFQHVEGAPPTPVAKNAHAFYEWAIGEQLRADRVLQRLPRPRGPGHPSPAGRSRVSSRPPCDREGPHAPSPVAWSSAACVLRRPMAMPEASPLELAEIQGLVLAGLPHADRAPFPVDGRDSGSRPAGNSDDSSAATNPTSRSSPRPRPGSVGFGPGPRDDPAEPPRRKPDYCLNIGHHLARTAGAGD